MPFNKSGGVVVMDSTVYSQKLLELLNDNNTYGEISPQTILKNANNFNKKLSKFSDRNRRRPEGSFFNSYYTEV